MATIQEIQLDANQKLEQLGIEGYCQVIENHVYVYILGNVTNIMVDYLRNKYPEINNYAINPFGMATKIVYIYTEV